MRCLALANELARAGWQCSFACRKGSLEMLNIARGAALQVIDMPAEDDHALLAGQFKTGVDLLVVDHYQLDAEFHHACRPWAEKILVIDELADRSLDCDFLLDQSPGRDVDDYVGLLPGACRLLLGPKFALLRTEFAAQRADSVQRRAGQKSIQTILVSFGASDINKLTLAALEALDSIAWRGQIDVVLGGGASHVSEVEQAIRAMPSKVKLHTRVDSMAELLGQADLAIGGAGISSWERCALGVPALFIVEAPNQSMNASGLLAAGAAVCSGLASAVNSQIIAGTLEKMLADLPGLRDMSSAAASLCDGSGVTRLMNEVIKNE